MREVQMRRSGSGMNAIHSALKYNHHMVAPIEGDVLNRLITGNNGPPLSPELARNVLTWPFADIDQVRVSELSAKSRAGTLWPDETGQLDWYLLLGDFLTIFQSKARAILQQNSASV